MAELRTRSPREAYATKPNVGFPVDSNATKTQEQARAATDLGQDEARAQTATVTAIDGTNIRADVDAAMVAQGATACNNAGARSAVAAVISDALLLSRTAQTTSIAQAATIPSAR